MNNAEVSFKEKKEHSLKIRLPVKVFKNWQNMHSGERSVWCEENILNLKEDVPGSAVIRPGEATLHLQNP